MPVFGTRPEAIKMAPVVAALAASPDCDPVVVVTAQHRGLLDDVLELFDIEPDIDLDIMRADQTPTAVAARALEQLERVFSVHHPDWVLVQGDTTTTMAAAIAAHYARVRVGHVEAGLRSFDRRNPFPEEMNRVVTGHISDLHFAPTDRARVNLLREGIDRTSIVVTGNTVIDALLSVAANPWEPQPSSLLAGLPAGKRWLLVTAHRRENFGSSFRRICGGLLRVADRGDVHIVYPVHPNPSIYGPAHELLGGHPAITLAPPLAYRALVWLLAHSYFVLTDSGGLQEEAPSLGKPVLVLRETTERPEAVEAGTARLVGTSADGIAAEAGRLLDDTTAYDAMVHTANPYGDGRAAERIVSYLVGTAPMAEWHSVGSDAARRARETGS